MTASTCPAPRGYPALAIAVGLLLANVTGASAQSATPNARPMASEQAPYGRYVTDREGRSLYLFEQDEQGSGISTCTDACVNAWPPYVTDESPEAGEGIDTSKLGTLERDGGAEQVTYAGWPLYYFSGDKKPGDALGQDVQHLGADWYLVSPEGKMIHKGDRTEADDKNTETQ